MAGSAGSESAALFDAADGFTRHYVGAALELAVDMLLAVAEPGDREEGFVAVAGAMHPDSMRAMIEDCRAFLAIHGDAIRASAEFAETRASGSGAAAMELAGCDFWLTRNGHGAGFWDGDWPEPHASTMTSTSQAFGTQEIVLGDDGCLHAEGGSRPVTVEAETPSPRSSFIQ